MDPEQESRYIKELLNMDKEIQDVSEESKRIDNCCVPKNVKALHGKDISKWKKDDRVYLETHNFPVMLDQVRKQPYVTFVGGPGSGKTATVRHIALILQKEGYKILVDKNKIEDYCNSVISQVLVIDDVLGVFGLNEFELHTINKYCEKISNPINPNIKIIITCREAVFRNELLSDCVLVKHENVVFLQSEENALNYKDKRDLLETYKIDRDLLDSMDLDSTSNMFPFLCKLYSSKKELKVYGPHFFISPIPCIIKELNSLKKLNKYQYVSLVLLMANGGILSANMLINDEKVNLEEVKKKKLFDEIKCCIMRKCKVSSAIVSFQLINALSEMEGTYTKNSGGEFTFINDSIFEIIAYHFGRQFPELILQCTSSNYIAYYVKVSGDNKKKRKRRIECKKEDNHESIIDLSIHLHESQYPLLAERLFKDLQNGEFYNVFGKETLKSPPVLQYFMAILKKKSYDDLYNLLISESSKVRKLKYEYDKDSGKDKKYTSLRTHAHLYLIDERSIEHWHRSLNVIRSSIRGIKWVICFGHYPILQYILDIMIQEKGNVDDLFRNCYNKRHHTSSNMKQYDTGTEVKSLFDHCVTGESNKKAHVGEDHETEIDTDNDTEKHTNNNKHIDLDSYTGSDSDDDTFFDTDNEPVIIEQCRLLCLGCYSGDLNTVKILLKNVHTDALNNTDWPSTVLYFKTNPLIIACEYGCLSIVKELLAAGADVNIGIDYKTPLSVACENGPESIVIELLKMGASLNETKSLYTPLEWASKEGHLSLVEEMIKSGADVNKNTPLLDACKNSHFGVVEMLIKAGADVNLVRYKRAESTSGIKDKTPLIVVCEKGYLSVVKWLITAGADVNIEIENKSPLIAACDGGFFNIIKYLIKSGAKVDPKNTDKMALYLPCYWEHLYKMKKLVEMDSFFEKNNSANEKLLIAACNRGNLAEVKEMINGGADINMKDGDKTPLIVACYKGHLHVVKKLIEAGADVNLGNEFISPLQIACYEGHLSIVKELYKAEFNDGPISSVGKALTGACFFGHFSVVKELIVIACQVGVNLKIGTETPLITANFMGHFNIFKELFNTGDDAHFNNRCIALLTVACYRGHIDIVKELIKEVPDVNQSDGKKTPLIAACEGGHIDVVEELIIADADVNQSDGNKTPLTAACEGNHYKVVQLLIDVGSDVNQKDRNTTPLTVACKKGHWEAVNRLIEADADVNQSDGSKTPLTVAAWEGDYWDVVIELINGGADVNLSDGNKTPLTAACEKGHWEVVQELIKAGADVNQSDGNRTPLTAACKREHWEVVIELVIADADVNQSDGHNTPLTAACRRGHWDVVRELIDGGADVNQCDESKTPLTAACEKGHWEVVQELIIAGADINQSDGNKTPLTAACERGHWKVVQELLIAGVDVN